MSAQRKDAAAETAAELLEAIRMATANPKNRGPKQLKSLAKAYALVVTSEVTARAGREADAGAS